MLIPLSFRWIKPKQFTNDAFNAAALTHQSRRVLLTALTCSQAVYLHAQLVDVHTWAIVTVPVAVTTNVAHGVTAMVAGVPSGL